MEAHESDLRDEVRDDGQIALIQTDYRTAALDAPTKTLLEFAVKLSLHPLEMRSDDIASLRDAGFDDETIVDAVQTISYFNYANRVMDALGVEPEPEMRHKRRA
ncbi:MAG: hypothetical protein DCC65_08290 [Planctomycetota bacterium]|nr:MAG: hypothetical protein DCC65_08290 [Planctomycetota bacterium]